MSPRDLRHVLTAWAAWLESGRPIPFNCYPPKSILANWSEERTPNYHSKPLWQGRMKSFWLSDVDRLLRGLPERRQLILLAVSLPRRGPETELVRELGLTRGVVLSTRKMAARALERL
jgi:hypothetical protein